MHENIQKFLKQLDDIDISNQKPMSELYDAVDLVENLNEVKEIIPDILAFMIKHAKSDLGSPGPLVHLIEKFYPHYIDQLVESVYKSPTMHTLWMINRILNNPKLDNDNRTKLLNCLSDVSSNPSARSSEKEEALEILKYIKDNKTD